MRTLLVHLLRTIFIWLPIFVLCGMVGGAILGGIFGAVMAEIKEELATSNAVYAGCVAGAATGILPAVWIGLCVRLQLRRFTYTALVFMSSVAVIGLAMGLCFRGFQGGYPRVDDGLMATLSGVTRGAQRIFKTGEFMGWICVATLLPLLSPALQHWLNEKSREEGAP